MTGEHARAAGKIVKEANSFTSAEIVMTNPGDTPVCFMAAAEAFEDMLVDAVAIRIAAAEFALPSKTRRVGHCYA